MSRTPAKEIKAKTNIVDVIGRYVNLKKQGANYVGCCCFHNEQTGSLTVFPVKQLYKCFGCGEGGDVISFLMSAGRTFKEALAELDDPYNVKGKPITSEVLQSYKPAPMVQWKHVVQEGEIEQPKITHYTHGKPAKVWTFFDEKDNIVGYTCRFETKGKKDKTEKVVLPYVFATNGTISEWRWKGFDAPRPLYNLHLFKVFPDLPIVISEGEKTADAITAMLPDHLSVTWIGGANGVSRTNWAPLHGRKIILWPDNDQPGFSAMFEIYDLIKEHCPDVVWVRPPLDAKKHWDAADATWTIEECAEFLKAAIIDVPKREDILIEETKELELVNHNGAGRTLKLPEHDKTENGHFKMLGYEKENGLNIYHFYSFGSKSIISLVPSQMGKSNLMQLAPLHWWELEFPAARNVFDADEATNFLITRSNRIGIFNEKWIRGRGAWIDQKRVVIHCGDKLLVDNVEMDLSNFNSKYIYEIGEQLGFNTAEPASTAEANKLIEIMSLLNWERAVNAHLLAGFCVIAPICGALQWRPHAWLTGGAGTGKSWIIQQIVRPCLGESALAVQGETSEAGLRQTLQHDALPVIFDEAEGNDARAQIRMQDVLALMRSASTADGGIMAKGSSGGIAKTYRIRSCFLFASISNQIANQADRSRVTDLCLKEAQGEQATNNFKVLMDKYNKHFSSEFTARLRARTIQLLPIILKNAKTFSNAAAAELGQQRLGDQVGALLAGAYSLSSKKLISFNDAIAWIKQRDWNEEKSQNITRDELACISHIMDQFTRLESVAGVQERTIGELVQICAKILTDMVGLVTETSAEERLRRLGIKVNRDYVIIANSADPIRRILKDTPWARNHNKTLLRIEGAVVSESERFAGGIKTRAVKIPLAILFVDKAPV